MLREAIISLFNEYRGIQKLRRGLEDKQKDLQHKKQMKLVLKTIVDKTPVTSMKELTVDVLIEGNYLVPKR